MEILADEDRIHGPVSFSYIRFPRIFMGKWLHSCVGSFCHEMVPEFSLGSCQIPLRTSLPGKIRSEAEEEC